MLHAIDTINECKFDYGSFDSVVNRCTNKALLTFSIAGILLTMRDIRAQNTTCLCRLVQVKLELCRYFWYLPAPNLHWSMYWVYAG